MKIVVYAIAQNEGKFVDRWVAITFHNHPYGNS